MIIQTFLNELAGIHLENVFNPYSDRCAIHDGPTSAKVRRANLGAVLESLDRSGTDAIWMGRELGYLGGRRTGLALTDEAHLEEVTALYSGAIVKQATKTVPVGERTAKQVWSYLRRTKVPPLTWNVFQQHAHKPGEPLSNRRFLSSEVAHLDALNEYLVNWLKPDRIIALGNDAASYSQRMGWKTVHVRHPSHGGIVDFRLGIELAYKRRLRPK